MSAFSWVLCRQCNFSLVFTFAEFLLKIVEKTPPSPVKEINWAKYPINKMEERRRKSKVKECMRKPQMCSSFSPFDFSSSRSPTFTFIYHFLSTLLQVFDRFFGHYWHVKPASTCWCLKLQRNSPKMKTKLALPANIFRHCFANESDCRHFLSPWKFFCHNNARS